MFNSHSEGKIGQTLEEAEEREQDGSLSQMSSKRFHHVGDPLFSIWIKIQQQFLKRSQWGFMWKLHLIFSMILGGCAIFKTEIKSTSNDSHYILDSL